MVVVPDIPLLSACGHYYVTWAPYSSLYDALKEVWAACCIPINNIWYEIPKGRSLQNIATVCKAENTNKITSLRVCSKYYFKRFYKYSKLKVVVCECMGSSSVWRHWCKPEGNRGCIVPTLFFEMGSIIYLNSPSKGRLAS